MGVSGSGKTTIGRLLAEQLGKPFYDADDFHSAQNKQKMAAGEPLTDHDREPWLQAVAALLSECEYRGGIVLACSALKESYRKVISEAANVEWVFLHGEEQLLQKRLLERKGHFISPALLASQLAILEEPDYGIHINIAMAPDEIIEQIVKEANG
jgi:carbohydrate kinase (thermoresistant glucokinase family)